MISRAPRLLLAPGEEDSVSLSQAERLAILRRLDKLEAEIDSLHRELDAVRAERDRLRKELGEARKALQDTKKDLESTKKELEDTKAQLAHHHQGVAATDMATYYTLDPSRGKKVVERVLGRDFAGTVVSDGWCAYNVLEGRRGVCWIHINESTYKLCDAKSKDKDVGRISRDLLKRMPHLFTFVRDARIPWHNNAGERAIRSVCVKRKMSGGLRSKDGAETYARLKTVHETVKRKGQDFLQAMKEALTRGFSGQPSAMRSTG